MTELYYYLYKISMKKIEKCRKQRKKIKKRHIRLSIQPAKLTI